MQQSVIVQVVPMCVRGVLVLALVHVMVYVRRNVSAIAIQLVMVHVVDRAGIHARKDVDLAVQVVLLIAVHAVVAMVAVGAAVVVDVIPVAIQHAQAHATQHVQILARMRAAVNALLVMDVVHVEDAMAHALSDVMQLVMVAQCSLLSTPKL